MSKKFKEISTGMISGGKFGWSKNFNEHPIVNNSTHTIVKKIQLKVGSIRVECEHHLLDSFLHEYLIHKLFVVRVRGNVSKHPLVRK